LIIIIIAAFTFTFTLWPTIPSLCPMLMCFIALTGRSRNSVRGLHASVWARTYSLIGVLALLGYAPAGSMVTAPGQGRGTLSLKL